MSLRKKIRTEAAGVFSLPWIVARELGLFREEGVEVEFLPSAGAGRNQVANPHPVFIEDHRLVSAVGNHTGIQEGKSDSYRACEWGQVRRTSDHTGGERIISKRAAVVSQAIFSAPGSRFTHPQTLRNQKVATRFHHGSHYLAIQSLEGFLKRDEIKVVHGSHIDGYEAVRRGEIAAVTLMEPWITLAEKEGFQRVVEAHYQGSEIASPEVDPDSWTRANRAVARAVKIFNEDKRKWVHHLIEGLPPQYAKLITPDDFYLPRLRYVAPAPYDVEEFQGTYDWLVSWNLIGENCGYHDLVDNRISAPEEVAELVH